MHKSLPNKLAEMNISARLGIKRFVIPNAHNESAQFINSDTLILVSMTIHRQFIGTKSNAHIELCCFHHLFGDTYDRVIELSVDAVNQKAVYHSDGGEFH